MNNKNEANIQSNTLQYLKKVVLFCRVRVLVWSVFVCVVYSLFSLCAVYNEIFSHFFFFFFENERNRWPIAAFGTNLQLHKKRQHYLRPTLNPIVCIFFSNRLIGAHKICCLSTHVELQVFNCLKYVRFFIMNWKCSALRVCIWKCFAWQCKQCEIS